MDRSYVAENERERRRLHELVERLSDEELAHPMGDGWTVAAVLVHAAFWDYRIVSWLVDKFKGTSGIDMWCRAGVMVLAGVVPPGSSAGAEAVRLARETPGVKRVETYFVSARPSWSNDFEIKEAIRAKLVADPALTSGRVDIGVYAGHVVLVGVVSSAQSARQFVADARSVAGVVNVTSFIQEL